jgi:hypothetical protein
MSKQDLMLHAESAIRDEAIKAGIAYAELSPFIRELLAKMYQRGGKDVLETLKQNSHLTP